VKNKDPPKDRLPSSMKQYCHHGTPPWFHVTIKRFLKTLDAANSVLGKLGKIAIKVYRLATLAWTPMLGN
jgi:hypothetical protein